MTSSAPSPATSLADLAARLPVNAVLPEVARALRANRTVVLQAPPGTGKTLLTAPRMLREPWRQDRRILLLEPRRLAARAAARAMAGRLNEPVGATVGYRMRLERRIGNATRIEILTEGLLAQRLLHDPEIHDTALVIFDEIHERNLMSDFSLALLLETRRILRPDLRLVIMSATLDTAEWMARLDDAVAIQAPARAFPVETRYLPRTPAEPLPQQAAAAVGRALRENPTGGILVFLPGEAEIRRTAERLEAMELPPDVRLHPLYGALTRERQDAAVAPAASGTRKVVLATSIAESSLTIEDIRIVIDGGWMRVPRFAPRYGMSRLATLRVSRDRADQRRGRAGRTAPGICYRLWDEIADRQLPPFSEPEILNADLAPIRLQCAFWGAREIEDLPWPTPPPSAAWRQAGDLLQRLGALDAERRITPHGRAMVGTPLHPRLAHMVEYAVTIGCPQRACLLAAALEEANGSGFPRHETDARRLLDLLETDRPPSGSAGPWVRRARKLAARWGRRHALSDRIVPPTGRMLAWAFPERIAQRRGPPGHFRLLMGQGAELDPSESLAAAEWLAVAELQGDARDARIRLAAPIDPDETADDLAHLVQVEVKVAWDRRAERVVARRRRLLGALVLGDAPQPDPDIRLVRQALWEGLRIKGVANLGWTPAARNLQARILFLRRVLGNETWPDVGDAALARAPDDWLGAWVDGIGSWEALRGLPLEPCLLALIGGQRRELDRLAPSHWKLPSGRRAPIRYDQGETPALAVKIQDAFGMPDTPRLVGGRIPVVLHLLSPAQRPMQITQDLAGFWRNGYPRVRKELRGRYPKHAWPEDPQAHQPQA